MSPATLRNFLLNSFGNVAPIAVALIALPVIAHRAGAERLGFLGLTWTLIGYLGLLDLGLSRVVLRRLAAATDDAALAREATVVVRICRMLFFITLAVVLPIALFFPIETMLGASARPELVDEARVAFRIVLATLPLVVVTGVLRGVLEGRLRFAQSNALKVVFSAWSYLVPLLVSFWWPTLPVLVASIAIGRVVALAVHIDAARRALPPADPAARDEPLRPLVAEGGWMTVTNLVGPFMVSFDRFAVSSIVSLAAAAYYIVPQEIVLRLVLLPAALAGTIFPLMAAAHGQQNAPRQHSLSDRSFRAALALSLPLCAGFALLAEPFLKLWMGKDFGASSAQAAAVFAVGLLANSVAQVPYASIQAGGRSDVTAKLHVAELPVFVGVLVLATQAYGIAGAAFAWSVRTFVDCIALIVLARKLGLTRSAREPLTLVALGGGLLVAMAIAALQTAGATHWALVGTGAVVACGLAARWAWQLNLMQWLSRGAPS